MTLLMKIKTASVDDLMTEAQLQKAGAQLPQLVTKACLYIGRGVFDASRSRFREHSTPGLAEDFLAPSVTVRGPDVVVGSVGSDKPYAAIQDEGGTITPKNGKLLSIPVRGSAADAMNNPSPRDFDGHWISAADQDTAVFIDATTEEALFFGVPSVEIKAKNYFSDPWRERSGKALDMVADGFYKAMGAE